MLEFDIDASWGKTPPNAKCGLKGKVIKESSFNV
jgi:hypothetical protein